MNQFLAQAQKIREALKGFKVHLLLGLGLVVVILNRWWPAYFAIDGLDPKNWLPDCYKLLVGHAARAAVGKIKNGNQ